MKRIDIIIEIGKWSFKFDRVVGRKTKDGYGSPYTAIVTINLDGKQPYVSGLLAKDDKEFTKADYKTITKFINLLGYPKFDYERIKDGKKREVEVS